MPKIYITDKIPENGIRLLRLKGFEVETNQITAQNIIDVFEGREPVGLVKA